MPPAIDLGASPRVDRLQHAVPISGWKDSSGKDSWPKNYGGGGYKGAAELPQRAAQQL